MHSITITDVDAVTHTATMMATELAELQSSGHADAQQVADDWLLWLETCESSLLRAYARRAFDREYAYLTSK
jgi:hypothetical protein